MTKNTDLKTIEKVENEMQENIVENKEQKEIGVFNEEENKKIILSA